MRRAIGRAIGRVGGRPRVPRDIVKAFRRPQIRPLPVRPRDRNGGFPESCGLGLSDSVAHGYRCPALASAKPPAEPGSPRHALLAENLGKPSLWVIISAPWYEPKPIVMAVTEHTRANRTAGRQRGPRGLLLLPLLLGACGLVGDEGPPPPCPRAVSVADARVMVRFTGSGRDLTDVVFEARVEDVVLVCEYDDGVIEADVRVRILTMDGPANRGRVANFAYFVAIATRDQRIVAREEFDLAVPFEGNRTRVLAVEEVSPRIPLRPGQTGEDYVVYVGLALTPGELQYNRENR